MNSLLPATPAESATGFNRIHSVPVRRYGQIVVAIIIVVIAVWLFVTLAQNKNFDYSVVGQYVFSTGILQGLGITLELTIIGMAIGIVVGVLVAAARMSNNYVLRYLGGFYVWLFRGVPLLVQILIWGNFALLFRTLDIGIPFTGITFAQFDTNAVLTTFVASCLGLGLNEGAYMAEVVRGGIISVDHGQAEAATALGMSSSTVLARIILPQAFRSIIPPTGNQLITLLKSSTLVSVISGGDLLTTATNISSVNYRTLELLIVATFWYLVVVSLLSIGQRVLERRASRGYTR